MNAINRFLLNIPLRYQILFPPLFAIMIMIISMLIISSTMNQSVKNSEVLNVRLQEMTHLSSCETKILQVFSEINRSLSNPESLENVDDYVFLITNETQPAKAAALALVLFEYLSE